jgi:hypothetical protein
LRISAEPVSEIDDMSTTRLGRAVPASTPPVPNRISFRSSVVETMVKTVAQWAIAVLSVTTSAPIWASGSAFDAVRFQTESSWPAFTRRAAIASPMRPRPIHPILCDALLIVMNPHALLRVARRAAVWEGNDPTVHVSSPPDPRAARPGGSHARSVRGNLPNSAVSRHLAGHYAGALTDSTAVATVIRDRGIRPPDPRRPCRCSSSCAPSWRRAIRPAPSPASPTISPSATGCRATGSCRRRPVGPQASELAAGHSDGWCGRCSDLVASAQRRVDIALLQPRPTAVPGGAARGAADAVASAAGRSTVRVIIGQYPPDNVDVPAFFKALTDGIDSRG